MEKTKKRPSLTDEKKRTGMAPASKHMQMAAAEEALFGATEAAKEEKPEEEAWQKLRAAAEAVLEAEKVDGEEEKQVFRKAAEAVLTALGASDKKAEADAEKEALNRVIRRLMDDMGAENLAALSEMIDRAEMQKLVRVHRLDEGAAKLFLAQQEKVRALREAEGRAAREAMYAEMRTDPLYTDVETRKNALEAFFLRTGVSPKEAYNALFGEERLRCMQREMEEKSAAAEKKAKHIPALAGGDAPDTKGHIRLSEAESWAAARAGMTPAEYARYKYAY